jgi:Protein of unknown function (DUF4238)
LAEHEARFRRYFEVMGDTAHRLGKAQRPAKRHHFLPESYLEGFCDTDGLHWVFDRHVKKYRQQPPRTTAVETHLYTITTKEGKSDCIERHLAELDGRGKTIIDRLDSRVTDWKGDDRVMFAIYLGFLYARTPHFDKEQLAFGEQLYRTWTKASNPNAEVVAAMFAKFEKETGETMADISPQEVFEMIRDDKYDVEIPRTYNIGLMLDTGLHLAEVILTLNWNFVVAPERVPFITSDVPFTTTPPRDHKGSFGVLTPGAISTIPLSGKTCLILSGEGGRVEYGGVHKDFARKINNDVARNSDRFVIARDRLFLEKIVSLACVWIHKRVPSRSS